MSLGAKLSVYTIIYFTQSIVFPIATTGGIYSVLIGNPSEKKPLIQQVAACLISNPSEKMQHLKPFVQYQPVQQT